MARRRRKPKLPEGAFDAEVTNLSHDGRGVAHIEGKTLFLDGALPGESVTFRYTERRKSHDGGRVETVVTPSPERVTPPCPYTQICGGCSLQHMAPEAQIRAKAEILAEQLRHFGGVSPEAWLAPVTAAPWHYRRKARLGVRYVPKKGGALVGFREKRGAYVADIDDCQVLDARAAPLIAALKALVSTMDARASLPQIEVAAGDAELALVFRHLEPLSAADRERLIDFAQRTGTQIYLQPKGPDTVHKIWPETGEERLYYRLADYQVTLGFHPMDFTQVNAGINARMVAQALELLAPQPGEQVLDLFCGLGNFSLPLARTGAAVTGVEGVAGMVERARENARLNGLDGAAFYARDLNALGQADEWAAPGYHKVLLDPPRSGAAPMMPAILRWGPQRVLYVSCNPATLARDAAQLVAGGYRLARAGVLDMFPHTAHVESMALFERR